MQNLILVVRPVFCLILAGCVMFGLYVACKYIRRKKQKRIPKNERKKDLRDFLVFSALSICLLLCLVPEFKDMFFQETEVIIGVVSSVADVRGLTYYEVWVETESGKNHLKYPQSLQGEKTIVKGRTYEFEYFVNSGVIKDFEYISDG